MTEIKRWRKARAIVRKYSRRALTVSLVAIFPGGLRSGERAGADRGRRRAGRHLCMSRSASEPALAEQLGAESVWPYRDGILRRDS